jgi:preprotein translocase subunit SecD
MRAARIVLIGILPWLVFSCCSRHGRIDSQPLTPVEIRLAVPEPRQGFTGLTLEETGESLYLSPEVVITNEHIAGAKVVEGGGEYSAVEIRLTPDGRQRFADFTGAHLNQRAAILVNGRIALAPTIRAQLTEGLVLVTGRFTAEEARRLAASIAPKK